MKILLIGGSGHMGTFLTPMLISRGHDVYIATRGIHKTESEAFKGAKFITLNAKENESLEALKAYKFDTVVDFPGTAYAVWQVLQNDISHLVACGSLWMYGYPHIVPTPEMTTSSETSVSYIYQNRYNEIGEMIRDSGKAKAVFTAIMPPNICGPGKIPLDHKANRSAENHKALMRGEEVILPDGPEALISPCDAEDLASLFALAIEKREAAAGEIFNAGSGYAIPFSDFVKIYTELYGVELKIKRVPWNVFTSEVVTRPGDWWHYYAHMCPDISKARRLLGYEPKYTPEQTVARAVRWMRDEGII